MSASNTQMGYYESKLQINNNWAEEWVNMKKPKFNL
jgi:hypothetical protein